MKLISITDKCVINNKQNTLVAEYAPIDFTGDSKTYYKLMSFQYNEICSECTLEKDEKRNSCILYKKAMSYQK